MARLDPIIAVKNVELSSEWYQKILAVKSMHGGKQFDILVADDGEVLLCLHRWGEHGHPTMMNPEITAGNGLILYFRMNNIVQIRENAEKNFVAVEEEIHQNPNSGRLEFSIKDPDGYYLTITEFHDYQ